MSKLSAFVCAHNEEKRLAACLEGLSFCDEIVVVLDRCTDGSERIARQYAHRIVSGIFPLEGPRRSAGQDACTGDWIFEVDADEGVTPSLAREIRTVVDTDKDSDWRLVPFDNFIGERLVRYGWGGSFGVGAAQRLYRRGVKTWGNQRLHPTVRLKGSAGAPLKNPIQHWVDDDITDMMARLDRYTKLRALDLAEHGGDVSLWSNAFRGVRRFWKCYVSRKGYREGSYGVLIAAMAAMYPFLSALRSKIESGGPSTRTPQARTVSLKPIKSVTSL